MLIRCLPILESDAQMTADITRFVPLPPDAQRVHDTTETEAEKLLKEIPEAMGLPLRDLLQAAVAVPFKRAEEQAPALELAEKDSRVYNAVDRKGCERGTPAKGKPKPALIYSVWCVCDGVASCQSWDMWGGLIEERIPLKNLSPFGPCRR